MRTPLLLTALGAAAVVGYSLAPRLINSLYGTDASTAEVASPTVGSDVPMATNAPAPAPYVVPSLPRMAHGMKAPSLPATRPLGAGTRKAPASSRPVSKFRSSSKPWRGLEASNDRAPAFRKTASENKTHVTMRQLGLNPSSTDKAATRRRSTQAFLPATNADLMAHRWVKELSGPAAHVSMTSKHRRGACDPTDAGCQRPEAPKDINVTGVVVKTERLGAGLENAPLDGEFATGNYAEHTPAVYVK